MESARRAYDILRGYIGQEWERISAPTAGDRPQTSEELARAAFEREMAKLPQPPPAAVPPAVAKALTPEAARTILGAEPGESFGAVKRRYDRLIERADPDRFPKGSEEARQAANIRTRVNAAFAVLREAADPTDRRFGSLEIE